MDNSPQQLYAQGGYQFAVSDPNNGIRRDGVKGEFGLKLLGSGVITDRVALSRIACILLLRCVCPLLAQSGHELPAFAAMHGPDLL